MFAPGTGWALLKAIGRAAFNVCSAGPVIDVFADLMDFVKEVRQECRKYGIDQQMKQVLEDLANLRFSLESEREALRVLVGEIAVGRSEQDKVDLVMMLSAVPARVRRRHRTGRVVPWFARRWQIVHRRAGNQDGAAPRGDRRDGPRAAAISGASRWRTMWANQR